MAERVMWELEILDQLYLIRGYNSRTELFKRTKQNTCPKRLPSQFCSPVSGAIAQSSIVSILERQENGARRLMGRTAGPEV